MSIHLFDHFASLEDPRVERTKLHALMDIVAVTICGVLCGADGWDDIHFMHLRLNRGIAPCSP